MQDKEPGTIPRSLVSVVDDDESVRESLPDLLREFGFTTLFVLRRLKSSLPPNPSV